LGTVLLKNSLFNDGFRRFHDAIVKFRRHDARGGIGSYILVRTYRITLPTSA
jgi:hypothetical protein